MDVIFSWKLWLVVIILAIGAAKIPINQRPILSYLINPSFWFSGAVHQDKSDSYYYSYNRKQIRFSPMGNWFQLGSALIEGADVDTFEVLDRDYARDKHHIYYQSTPITDQVDYHSFSLVDGLIAKDKYRVYIPKHYLDWASSQSTPDHHPLAVIQAADPASFELVDDQWSRDHQHYFYYFVKQNVDHASFQILTDDTVKDKHAVYIKQDSHFVATNISGNEVKRIDDKYLRDEERLYWYDASYHETADGLADTRAWLESVEYQDIATFQSLGDDYFILDDTVYLGSTPIEHANARHFARIDNTEHYSKDDQHVFFQRIPLAEANPHKFVLIHSDDGHWPSAYGRDSQQLYYKQTPIASLAQSHRVSVLSNEDFAIANHQVFYQGAEIRDANHARFELLERFARYATDGESVFYQTKKVMGVDIASAEVINRDMMLKDKHHIYWHHKRVEGADRASFTRSHDNDDSYDAEDDYFYYKNGERVRSK